MSERNPLANQLVISYLTLRKAVGWIGVLLPIVLLAGNLIFYSHAIPGSISNYYYTHMRNVLVGSLCAIGVFLLCYDGYDGWDERFTSVAGLAAVGAALCPTTPPTGALTTSQLVVGYVHVGFAALTFTSLAVMSFRFTKTYPEHYRQAMDVPGRVLAVLGLTATPAGAVLTPMKQLRNRVYRICGIAIFASMALAGASLLLPASLQNDVPFVYIFESIAIFAFGVSWFVKGQTLFPFLKDE